MSTDTPDIAAAFNAMAGRLVLNTNDQFGGAFVVVPPTGGGEPLSTLILDSKQDPAQFWNLLMTKCQLMLAELDQQQRTNQSFGRR